MDVSRRDFLTKGLKMLGLVVIAPTLAAKACEQAVSAPVGVTALQPIIEWGPPLPGRPAPLTAITPTPPPVIDRWYQMAYEAVIRPVTDELPKLSDIISDDDWVCEQHPNKPWPHDDCAGPGELTPALKARYEPAPTE